jgi:hypothetical protein
MAQPANSSGQYILEYDNINGNFADCEKDKIGGEQRPAAATASGWLYLQLKTTMV